MRTLRASIAKGEKGKKNSHVLGKGKVKVEIEGGRVGRDEQGTTEGATIIYFLLGKQTNKKKSLPPS